MIHEMFKKKNIKYAVIKNPGKNREILVAAKGFGPLTKGL